MRGLRLGNRGHTSTERTRKGLMTPKHFWPLRLAYSVCAPLALPSVAAFCAFSALLLVGCGGSSDGGADGSGDPTSVRVASVGAFRGELAALADQQFARERLNGNTDVELPIMLDGTDIGAIDEAEWLSIKSAYRKGWPVVLLQPTREQIEAVIATLHIGLDAPEEIAALDAIGFQNTALGDIEAVFEYINSDAMGAADQRVAAIGEWVADKQNAGAQSALAGGQQALDVLRAAQPDGAAPELESLMGSLSRTASLVVDRTTHALVLDAWAAHEFASGDDFYVFRLDTRSSGNNYRTRAFNRTTGAGGIITRNDEANERLAEQVCEARKDGTSCVRDRYLRRFEVTLYPYPAAEAGALTLARVTPSSGRESEAYTISTELNLGGSVNAGFSKEMGANASVGLTAGLTVNESRTISIPDATIVANHHANTPQSASWRFEMPDPPVLQVPGCPGRDLRLPFAIQRGTQLTEQWAIYRVPASARASLNNVLRIVWRLGAEEGSRTLDWAWNGLGANLPGCNLAGCNCTPVTVQLDQRTGGGVFQYPLADNTPAEEAQRPQLTSLSSAAARPGSPITLLGLDLRRTTRVFFGTVEAQVFFVDSDSQITVLVPANASGATVQVTVLGNGGISNALQFSYI